MIKKDGKGAMTNGSGKSWPAGGIQRALIGVPKGRGLQPESVEDNHRDNAVKLLKGRAGTGPGTFG